MEAIVPRDDFSTFSRLWRFENARALFQRRSLSPGHSCAFLTGRISHASAWRRARLPRSSSRLVSACWRFWPSRTPDSAGSHPTGARRRRWGRFVPVPRLAPFLTRPPRCAAAVPRVTFAGVMHYAESVSQSSPGLSALSGLPWVMAPRRARTL